MNFKNVIKQIVAVTISAITIILCGCGSATKIDYESAETFEAALNNGENLEGKTVRFIALELRPQSAFGYNIFAGEHLNFVSTENPGVEAGDIVTVKVTKIQSILGSWIIRYEKISSKKNKSNSNYSNNQNSTGDNTKTVVENTVTIVDNTVSVADNRLSAILNIKNGECGLTIKNDSDVFLKNNDYFDVVESWYLKDSFTKSLVIKVLGKKNAVINSSAILYDGSDNVIDKESDKIVIAEGRYNYFEFTKFGNDEIVKADISASVEPITEKYKNEFDAVTMEKCNVSDGELFVTIKQAADKIDDSGRLKFLLYKNGNLVGTDTEYLYSTNLNGKGSSDVVSIWIYGIDCDTVEFIYQISPYIF